MKTLGLLAVLAGLSIGCSGNDDIVDPPALPTAVEVTTGSAPPPRFLPASTVLAAGGTVTFRNGSPVDHNVTSATNAWPITALAPDEEFTVTLANAGNYVYQCTIHPGMSGVISVQ